MACTTLKVITLNVKGLNNPVKRKAILSYLEHSEASICLLQETHLLPKDRHRLKSRAFPRQYFSSTSDKKAGVAILMSRHFRGTVGDKIAEIKGRFLAYTMRLGGTDYTIGSLYAPNTGQEGFLKNALSDMLLTQQRRILVGGDLNIVMDPEADRLGHRHSTSGALSPERKNWLAQRGLVDIWRVAHPRSTQYSFYSHVHHTYARLDHFLGSTELNASITDAKITPAALSDHAAVTLSLTVPHTNTHHGRW